MEIRPGLYNHFFVGELLTEKVLIIEILGFALKHYAVSRMVVSRADTCLVIQIVEDLKLSIEYIVEITTEFKVVAAVKFGQIYKHFCYSDISGNKCGRNVNRAGFLGVSIIKNGRNAPIVTGLEYALGYDLGNVLLKECNLGKGLAYSLSYRSNLIYSLSPYIFARNYYSFCHWVIYSGFSLWYYSHL
jgi:hypothetical protein